MTPIPQITDDQLVSELWARDVLFLMEKQPTPEPLLKPAHLITLLAKSEDARVRMAVIPLFLRHPEFASETLKVDENLSPADRLYLHFYYTASVFLQQKYSKRLINIFGEQFPLPDLFSGKLGFAPGADPDETLLRLGKRHQVLSRRIINWTGTYEHAADVFIKHMEKFR